MSRLPYMDWLKRQEPEILWDDKAHAPPLKTEEDWIKAGEIVFDSPINLNGNVAVTLAEIRDPAWYQRVGTPISPDGTAPFARYFIREKGKVELVLSCTDKRYMV